MRHGIPQQVQERKRCDAAKSNGGVLVGDRCLLSVLDFDSIIQVATQTALP